jgi:hypothetical protein
MSDLALDLSQNYYQIAFEVLTPDLMKFALGFLFWTYFTDNSNEFANTPRSPLINLPSLKDRTHTTTNTYTKGKSLPHSQEKKTHKNPPQRKRFQDASPNSIHLCSCKS